jgi:ADP-heptose:LPS heptosyltransferase
VKGSPPSRPLPKNPEILLLRPDRLGDFLLSAPSIQTLQKRLGPGARFTIVAGRNNEAVARFLFPSARIWVFPKSFPGRALLLFRLAIRRYDGVLDFHSFPFSTTSALMALLAGGPRRVGFEASGEPRGLSRRIFNLYVPPPPAFLHERDKSFRLVQKFFPGLPSEGKRPLVVPPLPREAAREARRFFSRAGIRPNDRVLGIHPTLGKKDNRWSQEKYLELVGRVGAVARLKIVVVHGLGEEGNLAHFLGKKGNELPVFILPGNDLFLILEAARRFDCFVCNDSGLMHWAALATKVFAVFGPSDQGQWGPLPSPGNSHKVFRAKDRRCDSVSPRVVADEVKKYYNAGARSSG